MVNPTDITNQNDHNTRHMSNLLTLPSLKANPNLKLKDISRPQGGGLMWCGWGYIRKYLNNLTVIFKNLLVAKPKDILMHWYYFHCNLSC